MIHRLHILLLLTSLLHKTHPLNLQPKVRSKIASSEAKSLRRAAERATAPRPKCTSCHRPLVQCLCEAMPPQKLRLSTKVLILQHPSEFRRATISTVPLLQLVMKNVEVIVGRKFDLNTRAIREAIRENCTLALLYPSEEAIDLDDMTDKERALLGMEEVFDGQRQQQQQQLQLQQQTAQENKNNINKKTVLIAVDGTWSQARRMFLNSPDLVSKCHPIQFTSNTTTIYDRIRTEPKDYCISTSEAVAEALVRLEPVNGAQQAKKYIHEALEKMVQVQLGYTSNEYQLENDRDPRFQRRKLRAIRRQQSRMELEQSLFNDTTFYLDHVGDNGAMLRSLTQKDVMYVSRVNDDRSTHQIADSIRYHPNYCFGIEHNEGKLVACLLRYRTGELGMLYVDPEYRRKGYASILIKEFLRRIQTCERHANDCCAETFIMDGNDASVATFRALGWSPADESQKKGTGKRKAKRKWIYSFQS